MSYTESKIIGEKIKRSRILAKLTLKELSKKTGISYSTLSRIENGRRIINAVELLKISKLVNKPVTYFFQTGNNLIDYFYSPHYRK